jgi:formylglycine-generating enzyme required for sulfatase activity
MVVTSTETAKIVTFPYIEVNKITDRISLRIVRLNGRSAETASRENAVHIMTEADYAAGVFEGQLNMVRLPGGTFMMGGNDKDEQPRHRETVAPFSMGKYEVTVGEYNAFLRTTGRRELQYSSDDLPVSGVEWLDAIRYCNWLSMMTGRTPAYTADSNGVIWNQKANGFRLPTEAEWEYACRAGTTTSYSFGNSISGAQANYDNKTRGMQGKMPVGSYAPNPFGLYDMHGNVWERCWDYHNGQRAVRGGGYLSWGEYLRSSFRNWSNPKLAGAADGFRIAAF